MVERKGRFIVPIFIPYQGCPHKCVYCKQEDITGVSNVLGKDEIDNIISTAMKSEKYLRAKSKEIAFYGGTFTNLEKDDMIRLLEITHCFVKSKKFDAIRISTRPDRIDPSILKILQNYGVKTIEIGIQSLDDNVLKASGRGHSAKECFYASDLIKKYGFELGIQLMVGLPEQEQKSFFETIRKVIDIKPKFVRIYPTIVIKGTALESLLISGKYSPLSIEDTVSICAKAVDMLESNDISVIRIGLLNSQTLNLNYVAGPYHPSLGHMVRSKIFLKRLSQNIKSDSKTHTLKIGKESTALFWGYKREGPKILKTLTGAKEIEILKKDEGLEVKLEF